MIIEYQLFYAIPYHGLYDLLHDRSEQTCKPRD